MFDWRKEIFVPSPIGDFYLVSTHGRVWSLKREIFLKQHTLIKPWKHSYQKVNLRDTGKTKNIPVHRLVALTFIPNPENHETVDHINGIHHDNTVWNLRWMSWKESSAQGGAAGKGKKKPQQFKIQAPDREKIRQKYAAGGVTQKTLSEEYDVSRRTIGKILREKGPLPFC